MVSYLVLVVLIAASYAADPEPTKTTTPPEAPVNKVGLPTGPQYPSELSYNVNVLESQFQYPDFSYDKHYPRVQPPPVIYYGPAPPGQQFLYQGGAPPGNFLVPQPQPQPGPGLVFGGNPPGSVFGGNPPGSVFLAGYPRPAHIPPIEKDAEEIPSNLAGNHPVSSTGRPVGPSPTGSTKPEKLETFDEPSPAGEADVLAEADKNPNTITTRRLIPTVPGPKPGQFFVVNGRPLFSSYPSQGAGGPSYQYPSGVHQQNPGIYVYRQPQYHVPELYQPNLQDYFIRNSVTGHIADVRPIPGSASGIDGSLFIDNGNYISLNNADDFRHNFLPRSPLPVAPQLVMPHSSGISGPSGLSAPQKLENHQLKNYDFSDLSYRPYSDAKSSYRPELPRFGKEFDFSSPLATYDRGGLPSDLTAFDDYYKYGPVGNRKEEDDSVVIDAKDQHDDSEEINAAQTPEDPSLSQAQPSGIALAGNGGVASSGPRGTALVGNKGLAIANPQATAVAGPSKEESDKKTKPKRERQ